MAEFMMDELGMNFHPIYFSHSRGGVHMCYPTKISELNRMNLQGDEIQGMILIQDEGMNFNHLTYEFSSSFSPIYGIILPASKVWITGVCFLA